MELKKATRVIGAMGLVAILNSPDNITGSAASQKVFQPIVIEQDIGEKMTDDEKHYEYVRLAFDSCNLVFKGKRTGIMPAYCPAVGDVCTSYVFKTSIFYKHPGMDGARKYLLEDTVSLFSDVRLPDISISRFERDIMNGGSNGGIYEPSETGIMPGDDKIILAISNGGQYFIRYYLNDTKKNNKIIDEILKAQAKK